MLIEDEVTLHPISGTSVKDNKQLLVFFVTGNPGLISYYTDFLKTIQEDLCRDNGSDRNVIFYGSSLDGFEINKEPDPELRLPLSLPEQIQRVKGRIESTVRKLGRSSSSEPMPVVLVGHSVGCYMLMEVIAQWQQERDRSSSYQPVGGICLFPTVTEIAQSSKGRQLSVSFARVSWTDTDGVYPTRNTRLTQMRKWLLGIPYISNVLQGLVRIFDYIPRLPVVDWAAALNPGKLCADVTAAMTRSRHGVRQLIYMANDEMKMIKEDRWLPELWGVGSHGPSATEATLAGYPAVKLYFYWAYDDYWVDNKIRDALIKQRASCLKKEETREWPRMKIAENRDIMHCFSLDPDHSRIVAVEVAQYIKELKARCSL